MMKLMKYEIRKTMMVKWIILGIAALLEVAFLIGLWADKNEMLAVSVVLLVLLAFGSILVIGLGSILTLHRDMNTRQSYMLFMTPNSSYRILGAKVLENGISIMLTGIFFFALGALDVTLLFAHEGALNELWDMFQKFLTTLDSRVTMNFPVLASFVFAVLLSWFCDINAAYLGEVISAALLYSKKYNGFLSIVLILALIIGTSYLENVCTGSIRDLTAGFLVHGGVALACSALMYFLTARIMERRLSV